VNSPLSLCSVCVSSLGTWMARYILVTRLLSSMMIRPIIALIWCVCCGGEDVCGRYNKIGEIQQKVWFISCWTARGTKMWCFTSSARNYGRHTHVRNYPVLCYWTHHIILQYSQIIWCTLNFSLLGQKSMQSLQMLLFGSKSSEKYIRGDSKSFFYHIYPK